MPQMAPLMWETLFTIFIIIFMIMNMMIYHNPQIWSKNTNNKMNNKLYQQPIWKW